jgi:prevent-host-death family protein
MLPELSARAAPAPTGTIRSLRVVMATMTTMTRISVADAKAGFSALLERASRGERFLVLRHGRPMAALVPAAEATEPPPAPAGLAAVAGALADWDELAAVVDGIYAARDRAQDRPVPAPA